MSYKCYFNCGAEITDEEYNAHHKLTGYGPKCTCGNHYNGLWVKLHLPPGPDNPTCLRCAFANPQLPPTQQYRCHVPGYCPYHKDTKK